MCNFVRVAILYSIFVFTVTSRSVNLSWSFDIEYKLYASLHTRMKTHKKTHTQDHMQESKLMHVWQVQDGYCPGFKRVAYTRNTGKVHHNTEEAGMQQKT